MTYGSNGDDCDHRDLDGFGECPSCGKVLVCGTPLLIPLWPGGLCWVELRERHAELFAEIAAGIAGGIPKE